MTSTKLASPTNKHDGLLGAIIIMGSFIFLFPIFFKPILAYALKSLSTGWIYFLISIIGHTGFLAVANAIMYLLYTKKYAYSEQYRIVDAPWPWEKDPEEWRKQIKKTWKTLFFEHFVIVPFAVALEAFVIGPKFRFDLESYPDVLEIGSQFIFSGLVGDTIFYWSHRLLHHPALYPHIHKKHHEYNITVSIAAEYAHPVEFILGNMLPVAIGGVLLGRRMHIVTYLMFALTSLATTVDGHCGFDFPWSPFRHLPFGGPSSYHNFHHFKNAGNYSPYFTIWDTICGTNKAYYKYLETLEKTGAGLGGKKTYEMKKDEDKKKE